MRITTRRTFSILLILIATAALLGLYPYRAALLPAADDLVSARERLAPHLSLFTPAGEGPFPTVLVFHGCSGQSPGFVENVKKWLLPQGYALLFVDSLGARGIDDWHPVCDGKLLWGNERALDVYAALDLARSMPRLDHRRMALLGYSHGGWSILDALAYDGGAGHGFPHRPAGAGRCARRHRLLPLLWLPAHLRQGRRDLPVLMFLGGKDRITDHLQCLSAIDGLELEQLQLVQYGGADHVFDQRSDLNTYQPRLAEDAHQHAQAFLQENLKAAQ